MHFGAIVGPKSSILLISSGDKGEYYPDINNVPMIQRSPLVHLRLDHMTSRESLQLLLGAFMMSVERLFISVDPLKEGLISYALEQLEGSIFPRLEQFEFTATSSGELPPPNAHQAAFNSRGYKGDLLWIETIPAISPYQLKVEELKQKWRRLRI